MVLYVEFFSLCHKNQKGDNPHNGLSPNTLEEKTHLPQHNHFITSYNEKLHLHLYIRLFCLLPKNHKQIVHTMQHHVPELVHSVYNGRCDYPLSYPILHYEYPHIQK